MKYGDDNMWMEEFRTYTTKRLKNQGRKVLNYVERKKKEIKTRLFTKSVHGNLSIATACTEW